MDENRLIVFAKAPVPGLVKTRLCPPLTPVEAARLHAAFIKDTIEMALSAGPVAVTLAYTPEGSLSHFRDIVGGKMLDVAPQAGAGLGERMHAALTDAFASGAGKAALIGTDIPALTAGLVREAFEMLDRFDAVFAPTADGGYCLVALKAPCERLFSGIEWSTPHVLRDTLGIARSMGLAVHLLPGQNDVDTPADLAALTDDTLPAATRAVVSSLRARLSGKRRA